MAGLGAGLHYNSPFVRIRSTRKTRVLTKGKEQTDRDKGFDPTCLTEGRLNFKGFNLESSYLETRELL
jgi:hypothetical protein